MTSSYDSERPELSQDDDDDAQTAGLSGGYEGPGDAALDSSGVGQPGDPVPGQNDSQQADDVLLPSVGKKDPGDL